MSTISRYGSTCKVVQSSSKKTVEAEVMAFNEGRNLTVVMNKSVKLMMTWNGRLYEGRMAGMDFVSEGPAITKTQTSARG
jgi:flagellar biosynthesis/type III secretory pathway ATPase